MKFSQGQIVKWKGKRMEILEARAADSYPYYRIRVLEDTSFYKSGAITCIYGFALHPISPLELLAREA